MTTLVWTDYNTRHIADGFYNDDYETARFCRDYDLEHQQPRRDRVEPMISLKKDSVNDGATYSFRGIDMDAEPLVR